MTPPEVPARLNVPVEVDPVSKQDCEVVKLRLVTVTAVPLCVSVTVKLIFWVPVSDAVQFPLIELFELLPHPDNASARKSVVAMPKCFIQSSEVVRRSRWLGSRPKRLFYL